RHWGRDSSHSTPLEKLIDDAIKRRSFKSLEELQEESNESVSCKCSKQLIHKLNKLIQRELSKKEVRNVSLLLNCIQRYGRSMTILGEDGLTTMIKQGLVHKISDELTTTAIWAEGGKEKSDALINLAEDFFDALMVIRIFEATLCQVLDTFLHRIGCLVTDPDINICIQEEGIRKMNIMLGQMLLNDRKTILSSDEMQLLIMMSESQRKELADQWFCMEFVANAFRRIRDSEFETLQMPSDDKLEEFWIDFNVGSKSISFYVVTAEDDEEPLWETVCMPKEEVENYSIEVKDGKKLLAINMKNPLRIGINEGIEILIYFDLTLDVISTLQKVYGCSKFKGLAVKNKTSDAQTEVNIILHGSNSQAMVVQDQLSPPHHTEKGLLGSERKFSGKPECLRTIDTDSEGIASRKRNSMYPPLPATASNQKMSEGTMMVTGTKSYCASAAVDSTQAKKGRVKLPLEMKSSSAGSISLKINELTFEEMEQGSSKHPKTTASKPTRERSSKKISASKVAEMLQEVTASYHKPGDIIPDSQPVGFKAKPVLPGLIDSKSVFKKCWISDSPVSSCSTQEKRTSCLEYSFQQDNGIVKQQSFYSIFDGKSPIQEVQNNSKNLKRKKMEQQLTEKLEKITPGKNNKKGGAESYSTKRVQHCLDTKLSPELSTVETLALDSDYKTKCTETLTSGYCIRRSEVANGKFDDICQSTISNKQDGPKRDSCSKRFGVDLTCKEDETEDDQRENDDENESNTITQTMIKEIAAKYRKTREAPLADEDVNMLILSRSHLDKSQPLSNKLPNEKNAKRGSSKKQRVTAKSKMKDRTTDVYNFDANSIDEPTIKLGVKFTAGYQQPRTTMNTIKQPKEQNIQKSLTRKEEENKPAGRKNKKRFFTDTDTDGKTDISWLRESNRKPKRKMIAYGRQRKQNVTENTNEEGHAIPHKNKIEKKSKLRKKSDELEAKLIQTRPERKPAACRPRRKTAVQTCYRELSMSELDSDQESFTFSPRRERSIIKHKPEPTKRVSKSNKREATTPIVSTTPRELSRYKKIEDFRFLSFPAVSSIEKLRYEEMSEPKNLTSCSSPLESEPSMQLDSSPELLRAPSTSKGKTAMKFHKSRKSFAKSITPQSSPSQSTTKKKCTAEDVSSDLSLNSLPQVIPSVLQSCEVDEKIEEDEDLYRESLTKNNEECISVDKFRSPEGSAYTARSSSNSSLKTNLSKKIGATTGEETSSTSAIMEVNRRQIDRILQMKIHVSGPSSPRSSILKRIYREVHPSSPDGIVDEVELKVRGMRLHPRKLFKCDIENQSIGKGTNNSSLLYSDSSFTLLQPYSCLFSVLWSIFIYSFIQIEWWYLEQKRSNYKN
uniref:Synaptonemal complex protein 2 n=1 Tax=Callorhinchus milii TaxID=7868 RepID=A0A4W3J3M4_CALMI